MKLRPMKMLLTAPTGYQKKHRYGSLKDVTTEVQTAMLTDESGIILFSTFIDATINP